MLIGLAALFIFLYFYYLFNFYFNYIFNFFILITFFFILFSFFLFFLSFFFPFLLTLVADRVFVLQPGARLEPLRWES